MTKSVSRLIAQFTPKHYNLYLQPDASAMTFRGKVVISGNKIGRPSKRLTFHQNGLKITGAVITKIQKQGNINIPIQRINLHKGLFEVRIHSSETMYAGSYVVELNFEGIITPDMNGLYPCFFTHDNEKHTLLMTQFESHFARDVFPCIDEPEAKATFDLSLDAPPGMTVLANTPVKSKITQGDTVRYSFETTPRMSTYLLAFVIGEIHSKHTKTKSGVEVGVWGTIAQPADSFDFALTVAKQAIEFFEDYFGVAYPLKKADHVAVPDFSSGAMENWGLVTYREVALLSYPQESSVSAKELIALVICHETSHQWFGNLVTMKWWNELWLNESFANLMEYRAVDALFPEWHIWNTFYVHEGLSALKRDSTPGVQAIQTDVHHPDEINTLFDPSIVYAKGGRMLYMLMSFIGEDAFRRGLTDYFNSFAYQNTTGNDLWDALSKASNVDVGSFMNPWLQRSGFPVLHISQIDNSVHIYQEHFLEDREKSDKTRVWDVPLFVKDGFLPGAVLSKDRHTFHIDTKNYIFANHNGAGHFIVHYSEPEHREYIQNQIKDGALNEVDRLMVLYTSTLIARARYGTFAEALSLLSVYSNESSESVWDIMSVTIAEARRFIDESPELEKPIKNFIASLVQTQLQRLGWTQRSDESPSDSKLRATIIALAAYADIQSVVEQALEMFEAYPNDQQSVDGELRGVVFGVAVKQDVPKAVDYLLDLHAQTPNSDLKRDIASALTSTRSEDIALRLLKLLKDPDIIKPQDADRWLAQLLHNRYTRSIAWDWMVLNWPWIEETYGSDKSFDYMPRYAAAVCNTKEWQAKFNKFFDDKRDNPILKRNILIGQAEIAARVAWLDADRQGVEDYFRARSD